MKGHYLERNITQIERYYIDDSKVATVNSLSSADPLFPELEFIPGGIEHYVVSPAAHETLLPISLYF